MKTIDTPYLIQRAKFTERDDKIGIDSILYFDYMGASEFEWGALPKSLKRIREKQQEYNIYYFTTSDGLQIDIYCKEEHSNDDIQEYLNTLRNGKFRLKCYSGFTYSKYGPELEFDFWWDLDNDIMFWRHNKTFETKFRQKIKL